MAIVNDLYCKTNGARIALSAAIEKNRIDTWESDILL